MIYAYEDEDNAPMVMNLPLPYPVRTWEEVQEEWNEKQGVRPQALYGLAETGGADPL